MVQYERLKCNKKALGEDVQRKLRESRVALIGSSTLAQMVLANLIGLGVGNIYLVDNKIIKKNEMNFLCGNGEDCFGKDKIYLIKDQITEDYPDTKIDARFSMFDVIEQPQIIIEATNNKNSKRDYYKYSLKKNIPSFSLSSSFDNGVVSFYNPHNGKASLEIEEIITQSEYHRVQQGSFSSGVIAGLVGDQIIKILTSYDINNIMDSYSNLYYNLFSDNRNERGKVNEMVCYDLSKKRALVIGGGGVGNFVVLNLALLGFGYIDIIDGDKVEVINNNRQILNARNVGRNKAESLEERVREINPRVEVGAFPMMLNEDTYDLFNNGNNSKSKYDVIFGCVDTPEARLIANRLAIDSRTLYIDGGIGDGNVSSLNSGDILVYIPGTTKCIDCQKDLKDFKLIIEHMKAKQDEKRSCIGEVNPSIVPPHIIIGSTMVGESLKILFERSYKGGIFMYDSFYNKKIRFEIYDEGKKKFFEGKGRKHGC